MLTLINTPPPEQTVFVGQEECAGFNLSFSPAADLITRLVVALRS